MNNTESDKAQAQRLFEESARVKETLADIIPALERASGLKADDFRRPSNGGLTGDEIAALWMSRAILEAPTEKAQVMRAGSGASEHSEDSSV